MLVEQCSMERDERLPLLLREVGLLLAVLRLQIIDFYAFVLDHDQARINGFDFLHYLLLGNWTCHRLPYQVLRIEGDWRWLSVSLRRRSP